MRKLNRGIQRSQALTGLVFLLPAAFLFPAAALQAQAPPAWLGTKTPYVRPAATYTPAPAGFRPVFVNYVGRHGARYMTKAGPDVGALKVLDEAEKARGLTPLGLRVRTRVQQLCVVEKDHYENITLLGAAEQKAIGQRLFDNYRPAFTGRGLDLIVTYKVRTQQSADAFLQGFSRYNGPKRFSKLPDSLDAALRFYDLSPAYRLYKKSPVLQRSLDSLHEDSRTAAAARAIASRVFNPSFLSGLNAEEQERFAEDLYDLYSIQFSLKDEIGRAGYAADSVNLGIAFGSGDLRWLDFVSGASDFLEKGPGFDSLGIQVKVAIPLLVDFISRTDAIVVDIHRNGGAGNSSPVDGDSHPPVDAVLRFTHAEAIAPFAALLGLPAASTPAASLYRYPDHWRPEAVIPLSANIQWILYSDGKEYLVKVLLNEKETALPVPTTLFPYYKWADLRRYYLDKMLKLKAVPGQDMLRYLRDLQ